MMNNNNNNNNKHLLGGVEFSEISVFVEIASGVRDGKHFNSFTLVSAQLLETLFACNDDCCCSI
jgi:hypothetical protein